MASRVKIHRRVVQHEVRVGLDPKEREPLTKDLLDKLDQIDKLRIEAKDTQATYRKRIKEITEESEGLRVTLEQGHPEMMECEEVKNFNTKTVKYIRTDTKAVVETRPMTDDDAQMEAGEAPDDDEGDKD